MLGTTALSLGFLLITALFLTAGLTVLRFGPINTTAGLLLLPVRFVAYFLSASLTLYAATTN